MYLPYKYSGLRLIRYPRDRMKILYYPTCCSAEGEESVDVQLVVEILHWNDRSGGGTTARCRAKSKISF